MNDTTEATEYDVAQALGHPLPAPRNSTVWVASLVGEAGGFLQGVGASKEDALNNLLESLLEEWDVTGDSPWEDRAYEVYADHAISMGEMDSYARNLVYEEEKSLYIGSRSREEIFQDFLKDETLDKGLSVAEFLIP